jgi:hypothetical protein
MMHGIKKHFWFYISFAAIQLLGLALILLVSYDKQLQMTAILMTTMFYVFWGLLHQHLHHHLNAKIVTEYILIGGLGVTISFIIFGF